MRFSLKDLPSLEVSNLEVLVARILGMRFEGCWF